MRITKATDGGNQDLLLISVFTFFTVTLWIIFEVLKTMKTTTLAPKTTQTVVSISSKIDKETIQNVVRRKQY